MNKQDLEAKRLELETSFNKTKEQINNLNIELYRLQGEHRLVSAELEKLEEVKPSKKEK